MCTGKYTHETKRKNNLCHQYLYELWLNMLIASLRMREQEAPLLQRWKLFADFTSHGGMLWSDGNSRLGWGCGEGNVEI